MVSGGVNEMDDGEWKIVACFTVGFSIIVISGFGSSAVSDWAKSQENRAAIEAGLVQETDDSGNVVWTNHPNASWLAEE